MNNIPGIFQLFEKESKLHMTSDMQAVPKWEGMM